MSDARLPEHARSSQTSVPLADPPRSVSPPLKQLYAFPSQPLGRKVHVSMSNPHGSLAFTLVHLRGDIEDLQDPSGMQRDGHPHVLDVLLAATRQGLRVEDGLVRWAQILQDWIMEVSRVDEIK